MAQQGRQDEYGNQQDETFKRHGPEPPENDSGPSPSVEEQSRSKNRQAGVPDPSTARESGGRPQR